MTSEIHFVTPLLDRKGQVRTRVAGSAQVLSISLGPGLTLEMAAIPGGIYQMGSAGPGSFEDERPLHLASIRPFYLGCTTVTQEQWLAVMGRLPAVRFKGSRRPIEQISWADARKFCQRLGNKSGVPIRLPSEAEWEYACRANTATPFSFGETLTTDVANFVGEGYRFAEEPPGIYRHGTSEVGSFPPNAFGLFEMHGNVWEWCADAWHDDYTGGPSTSSPWGGKEAEFRVARGGSWHEPPQHCRSATRLRVNAIEKDEFTGFRVAMDA